MTAPPAFLADRLAADPAVFSIEAGVPFLPALLSPLLSAYADAPEALADLTLYLPNRRAVLTAGEVCAALGERAGRAVILPRFRALGDVDEDELLVTDAPLEAELSLRPPADPLVRRLTLARLVREWRARTGHAAPWTSALKAADTLGRFLDGLFRDGVPFEALASFSPADLDPEAAIHWKENLAFLSIIGSHWPSILEAGGEMEPALRRSMLLDALTDTLADRPQTTPVIVAGPLGTAAATARFMAAAARAPSGLVVLQGLDLGLDDAAWTEARGQESHPQSLFARWLSSSLGTEDRSAVARWPSNGATGGSPGDDRRAFLSLALKPAGATETWFEQFADSRDNGSLARACGGLKLAAAQTEDEEAAFCALLLREALATPEKTAMLVTPDRGLARRVTAKLRAWDVALDDSGGLPLKDTVRGRFVRLAAAVLDTPDDPRAILSLLSHPLSRGGLPAEASRSAVRGIDRRLRGPAPLSWGDLVDRAHDPEGEGAEGRGHLLSLLAEGEQAVAAAPSLSEKLSALIAFAEALAATEDEAGAKRLWQFEDGEALSARLDALLNCPALPEETDDGALTPLLEALLEGGVVRRQGAHPRLAVYGLLEARLQSADRIIVGGLVEGVWPPAAPEDAFLSRTMMRDLGLTVPEMLIGRAAHDFVQGASGAEVFLTYPKRRDRTPTTPSRWMVRLQSFLEASGLLDAVDDAPRLRRLDAVRHLPDGPAKPAGRPAPAPATPLRRLGLRTLTVTEIGRLLRDPYAVYARRILGLRVLDPVGREIDARNRGSFFHYVAENVGGTPGGPDLDWSAIVDRTITACFSGESLPPEQLLLWTKQAERTTQTLAAFEPVMRRHGAPVATEAEDQWEMPLPGGPVTLRGRIDRVDQLSDGTLSLTDFKGSGAPTLRQDANFDPQLSVLAMMVEAGAFAPVASGRVSHLSYLPLFPSSPTALSPPGEADGKHAVFGDDLRTHIEDLRPRLIALLDAAVNGDRPFPSQVYPEKMLNAGDYDHLARRGEWGILGDPDANEGGGDGPN